MGLDSKRFCLAEHNSCCVRSTCFCLLLLLRKCMLNIACWILPIAYCLLPIAYCLLPVAYCLLPIACQHFPSSLRSRKRSVCLSCMKQICLSCSIGSGSTCIEWKIMYFIGKTTYSDRKFDIIDLNKWFNLYLFLIGPFIYIKYSI